MTSPSRPVTARNLLHPSINSTATGYSQLTNGRNNNTARDNLFAITTTAHYQCSSLVITRFKVIHIPHERTRLKNLE
ncbi:Hypothetical protein NTJ_09034 [Nesidiocoris tenuis]|uniref:Uncharacterized protein n=1 Tax=Nesidiocoris tenuis TaxID=355587 RepID=A0ABN7AVL5_9HEMI|nr:Hypothetical protein NTJ_09034 [Nesidiocoris tenuis]